MAITTLQLTVLLLGILLLLALIYIFYNCFTNTKSGESNNSLDEVVVDSREGNRADERRKEIFQVSTRFQEILSEDSNRDTVNPIVTIMMTEQTAIQLYFFFFRVLIFDVVSTMMVEFQVR